LCKAGIELCFAELKDPVKDKLKRFGLFSQIGDEFFFPTIEAAVRKYLEKDTPTRTNGAPDRATIPKAQIKKGQNVS
jgi:hypothetical protein